MLRVCLPIRRSNRFCLPLLYTFPLDNGHAAIYPCKERECARLSNAAKLSYDVDSLTSPQSDSFSGIASAMLGRFPGGSVEPVRQGCFMSLLREADAEPLPGYRLIEPLGTGGFGEVWKCEAPGGLY